MGSLAVNHLVGIKVVGFTRELNKESLLYCYPIYTITCGPYYDYASTVYPTLKSMCYVIHEYIMCILCSSNVVNMLLDIII